MTNQAQHIIDLVQEADVGILTQAVRHSCHSNRFDQIDTEQMVLACSEIGHNAVRHGRGGNAEIFELKKGKMIRVTISDKGPGIPNIDLAKREGYSTVKTSLGLGLEGAQRLVDNFVIDSKVNHGTKITLDKYRPISKEVIDYGLVSIPDNKYNYNGDQYILKEYDGDSILLGVIDGPGQGYDAHAIAQTCKQFVENNYRKPLSELLTALNILMQESNDEVGITCAFARITPGEFEYIGLGDTHAYLMLDNNEVIHLKNQQGRVGYVRTIKSESNKFKFASKMLVVFCTDGLKTIYDGLTTNEEAQNLANTMFDHYHRPSGDATILTAKYNFLK